MTTVRLDRSDGAYLTLTLPDRPEELLLSQKQEFDFGQMELIEVLKRHEDNPAKGRVEYIVALGRAIGRIFDVEFSEIMNLKCGNITRMSEAEFVEYLSATHGNMKGVKVGQFKDAMLAIWGHMARVVAQAEESPMPKSITWKGREYELPKVEVLPSGRAIHKSLTYKQAIEAIQVNNMYDSWLANNSDLRGGATHSGMLFTKTLSEIALLLHCDDIPLDDDVFPVWLNEQIRWFEDIDWQTAYWLLTWFRDYIDELRGNPENTYFFESTYEPSNADEREAWNKAKAKGKKIYQRVGMKTVTAQLLELNPFQAEGRSKIESIMRAPFTTVVNLISTHNARG